MTAAVAAGKQVVESIPDRRLAEEKKNNMAKKLTEQDEMKSLPLPVWRCKVCGYLCARNDPPEVCPICKAKKERFERFM